MLEAEGRNPIRSERGTITIEFAIVALLLFLMSFLIIEFGRAILIYHSIAHGAREGTRYAIVRGEESGRAATASDVEALVKARTLLNAVQVTTTWEPDNKFGSVVQVHVSYDFVPLAFPAYIPAMTFTSTSRMVISF